MSEDFIYQPSGFECFYKYKDYILAIVRIGKYYEYEKHNPYYCGYVVLPKKIKSNDILSWETWGSIKDGKVGFDTAHYVNWGMTPKQRLNHLKKQFREFIKEYKKRINELEKEGVEQMSSVIEVLESNLKQVKKAYKNFGDYSSAGIVIDKNLINALDEAIVALEQKESDKGWVCDVCDRETASCLSLCPDCNDRKQGALEELRKEKRLLKKIINLDLNDNENYVSPEICKLIEDELKRIKELEGVEQK